MSLFVIVGPLILGAVLWLLLDRHERRRVDQGLPRHSPLRLVFAAAGLLVALFAGGCAALLGFNTDGVYVTPAMIAVIAGPVLLLSGSVFWLAMARRKGAAQWVAAFIAGATALGGGVLLAGLVGVAPLSFAAIGPVAIAALVGGVAAVAIARATGKSGEGTA